MRRRARSPDGAGVARPGAVSGPGVDGVAVEMAVDGGAGDVEQRGGLGGSCPAAGWPGYTWWPMAWPGYGGQTAGARARHRHADGRLQTRRRPFLLVLLGQSRCGYPQPAAWGSKRVAQPGFGLADSARWVPAPRTAATRTALNGAAMIP